MDEAFYKKKTKDIVQSNRGPYPGKTKDRKCNAANKPQNKINGAYHDIGAFTALEEVGKEHGILKNCSANMVNKHCDDGN